jgi:hypothetical protein
VRVQTPIETTQQRPQFDDTPIEITGPVLAGFQRGLDTEIAPLDSITSAMVSSTGRGSFVSGTRPTDRPSLANAIVDTLVFVAGHWLGKRWLDT